MRHDSVVAPIRKPGDRESPHSFAEVPAAARGSPPHGATVRRMDVAALDEPRLPRDDRARQDPRRRRSALEQSADDYLGLGRLLAQRRYRGQARLARHVEVEDQHAWPVRTTRWWSATTSVTAAL